MTYLYTCMVDVNDISLAWFYSPTVIHSGISSIAPTKRIRLVIIYRSIIITGYLSSTFSNCVHLKPILLWDYFRFCSKLHVHIVDSHYRCQFNTHLSQPSFSNYTALYRPICYTFWPHLWQPHRTLTGMVNIDWVETRQIRCYIGIGPYDKNVRS